MIGKRHVNDGATARPLRQSVTLLRGLCRSLRRSVAAHLLLDAPRLTFGTTTCSGRLCAPAARPVAVGSIPDFLSNVSSIGCPRGDLARPGPGPADRGAAAAVRAAARHRLG